MTVECQREGFCKKSGVGTPRAAASAADYIVVSFAKTRRAPGIRTRPRARGGGGAFVHTELVLLGPPQLVLTPLF